MFSYASSWACCFIGYKTGTDFDFVNAVYVFYCIAEVYLQCCLTHKLLKTMKPLQFIKWAFYNFCALFSNVFYNLLFGCLQIVFKQGFYFLSGCRNNYLRCSAFNLSGLPFFSRLAIILVSIAGISMVAQGQVLTDVSSNGATSAGGASSLTFTHPATTTAYGRLLLVGVSIGDNVVSNTGSIGSAQVSSVTYGGTPLTFLGARTETVSGNTEARVEMWYLTNPVSTSANIVVNLSATEFISAGATTFSGVNQTTPLGAFQFAEGANQTTTATFSGITSATDEVVYSTLGWEFWAVGSNLDPITVSTGSTLTYQQSTDDIMRSASATTPGAASVNVTYTIPAANTGNNAGYVIGAVSIKLAPACALTVSGTQVNASPCFGAANGSINITASSGTTPYTYDWADISGTNNVEDRTGLVSGTYSVTVTDAASCTASAGFTILPAAALSLSTVVTDVFPAGSSNGAINLTATGGISPYTYDWADVAGTSNSEDRSALPVGTYTVTVTDANNCTATTSATVAVQTFVTKHLYLSDPSQALDRTDPVASADATTAQSYILSFATINTVGAAASSNAGNVSSYTFSYNSGTTGVNRALFVGISYRHACFGGCDKTVGSVTYGGQALTQVGVVSYETGSFPVTRHARVYIYRLVNPPTGANNLVVNWSSSLEQGAVIGAVTYDNVNQSTPTGTFASATGTSTTPSVTVTGDTDRLMFGVVGGRTTSNYAVTGGGTQLWSQRPVSGETAGSGQSEPGAASVTLTWSGSNNEWAAGGVSIIPTANVPNITFTQSPALCSALTIKSGQTITVTNYVSIVSGTMPANPNITAVLKYGATTIATLTNPTYSGGLLTWTGTIGSDMTVPAGQAILLEVTTAQSGVSFTIDYDSQTKPSKISLPVTTFIDITSYAVYNASYPGGSVITSAIGGTTVYARAVVTDPFGFDDITGMDITITPPGTTVAATSVATAGCTRTYEYAWATPVAAGTYSIPATAKEGLENTVTDLQALSFGVLSAPVSLTLSMSVNNATVLPGGTLQYTLTLTNASINTATNIKVKDQLPGGVVFNSASPSAGTYNPTTGIWAVPSLAGSNTTATLIINVTAQ